MHHEKAGGDAGHGRQYQAVQTGSAIAWECYPGHVPCARGSTGFSSALRDLVNFGAQAVSDGQDGIGARGTIAAGLLEASWIDKEPTAAPVACWPVGMAIDDTVGLWKDIPEAQFNVRT